MQKHATLSKTSCNIVRAAPERYSRGPAMLQSRPRSVPVAAPLAVCSSRGPAVSQSLPMSRRHPHSPFGTTDCSHRNNRISMLRTARHICQLLATFVCRGPAMFQSRPRWQAVSVAAVQCSSRCRCHNDTHTRRSVQRTAATVDSTLKVCLAGFEL